MKWTGLTGGIATGKSTAKKLLESLGYPVVDADLISHELTQTGKVGYELIVSHFGHNVLNKDFSLNRKTLADIVFRDEEKKQKLESILHPLIREEVAKRRDYHSQKNEKICFYDVPLLFEKKMQDQFDRTILIWCEPQVQLERLIRRNGLSTEEALLRISNQMSLIDKVKLADHCVDNSGDEADLRQQLVKLAAVLT